MLLCEPSPCGQLARAPFPDWSCPPTLLLASPRREALTTRVNKTLPRKLETAIKVRPPGADTITKKSPNRR